MTSVHCLAPEEAAYGGESSWHSKTACPIPRKVKRKTIRGQGPKTFL